MQSIKSIFQKQKEYLKKQHQNILNQLNEVYQRLEQQYGIAYKGLDSGRYYVNQTFMKEVTQALQNLQTIISINCNRSDSEQKKSRKQLQKGNNQTKLKKFQQNDEFLDKEDNINRNPYLVDITLKQINEQLSAEFAKQVDISTFIANNKENSHIVLTKNMLESSNPVKLSIHCGMLTSVQLKSHPYRQDFMIGDIDLEKITLLSSRITSLNISGSSVTDKGLSMALQSFPQLKELNLSNCCLLTDQSIKKLAGDKFVNLKLNELNSISEQAVLSLIVHSYNLNYLEIKSTLYFSIPIIDCRHINTQQFFIEVSKIYTANQANFKWLEVSSDIGIDLFINKLAYLTHLTSAQYITDREVAVLLGDGKSSINGLFFCCCEDLNQQTVELICKEINNLKRLKLSKFMRLNDTHVKEIVSQFPQLEFLNLEECYSLTNNSLKFISQNSQNLRYLNVSWCRAINDEGIQALCENQNLVLESIDLSNLKFLSDQGIIAIARNCLNLKSLIMQKCDQVTDQAINQVSQRLPLLKELVVNYCQNLTDSSLSLVATRLRNLTRLQIQWCQVTQKCVGFIAQNLKNLKILNLNYCPSVCDHEILLIADNINSKIEILKLESCDKISQEAFMTLSQSSKNLKYLDLRQCIGVTDEVIKSFCASSQSHLKFIDLSWCTRITDKSLFSLSQYQHQLSSLNLSGCSQITDIGMEWIITTLKNLQYLNLSLCQKITDKSVSLISQLKKLRKLMLCDLKRISDVSISNLSDLTGLEELQISGCCEVSSSSLLAILHNLQKLSGLNINECPNIKSEFLSIMLDKINNLRKLQLSSLQIDDDFLQNLGRNMHKLQYLNVSMCGKITDQGLVTLVEQIPSLIKVDFQNTSITNRTKQKIVHTLNCRRLYNITLD